jgi:hypothetical protein
MKRGSALKSAELSPIEWARWTKNIPDGLAAPLDRLFDLMASSHGRSIRCLNRVHKAITSLDWPYRKWDIFISVSRKWTGLIYGSKDWSGPVRRPRLLASGYPHLPASEHSETQSSSPLNTQQDFKLKKAMHRTCYCTVGGLSITIDKGKIWNWLLCKFQRRNTLYTNEWNSETFKLNPCTFELRAYMATNKHLHHTDGFAHDAATLDNDSHQSWGQAQMADFS